MLNILITFFQTTKINQAACDLAKGVAQEGGAVFAGSICQTASLYSSGAGKDVVTKTFRRQIEIFLQNDVDLLIAEVRCLLLYYWGIYSKLQLPCQNFSSRVNQEMVP